VADLVEALARVAADQPPDRLREEACQPQGQPQLEGFPLFGRANYHSTPFPAALAADRQDVGQPLDPAAPPEGPVLLEPPARLLEFRLLAKYRFLLSR